MDPWRSKRAAGRSTTFEEESTVWPHAQHEKLPTETRRRSATQQGARTESSLIGVTSEQTARPWIRSTSVTISARANSWFTVVQQHQWQDCVCSNTTCQQNLGSAESDSQPTGEIESGRGQHAVLFCSQLGVCRSTCSGRAFTVILS